MSSEMELPVGDAGGMSTSSSLSLSSRRLDLSTAWPSLDFCDVFLRLAVPELSMWVTSPGSSSLEMVELQSEVTVRLDSGRSEKEPGGLRQAQVRLVAMEGYMKLPGS